MSEVEQQHSELLNLCVGQLRYHVELIHADRPAVHIPSTAARKKTNPDSHFHYEPEIFIQVHGKSDFKCSSRNFVLSAGTLCVMPAGIEHRERLIRVDDKFLYIVAQFRSNMITLHSASATDTGQLIYLDLVSIAVARFEQIKDSFHQACLEYHNDSQYTPALIKGYLLVGLSLMLDELANPHVVLPDRNLRLSHCKRLVMSHLDDPNLSVVRLADMMGYSADYLSNIFHRERGLRLSDYINRCRVNHAKMLLTQSEMNVSQVARACGYRDSGYFSRVFKKLTGLSPMQFRAF